MRMTRSTGVTVWAVSLILGGGLALAGSVVSSAVSGAMRQGVLEERFRQLDAQLSQAKGPDGQPLPPEKAAQLRQQLEQMRAKMTEFFESPAVRMTTWLHGVLGLAALIAGIGLLMLKGWARVLTIWQAVLSMAAGLVSQIMMHGWQQEMLQSIMSSAATEPAQQRAMQQMVGAAQTFGLGVGILLLVGWNGALIWFFSRSSVKAQFEPVAGQPA